MENTVDELDQKENSQLMFLMRTFLKGLQLYLWSKAGFKWKNSYIVKEIFVIWINNVLPNKCDISFKHKNN